MTALPVLNVQPTEKPVKHRLGSLEVHSIFKTIQGEGPFAGTPAIFLRLAGCNLRCKWCDTDYTSKRNMLSPLEIIRRVNELTKDWPGCITPLIVLTGGEPFRQSLSEFVRFALRNYMRIQIETNGTLYQDLPYFEDDLTIVCSPKTPSLNREIIRLVDYYKYIVQAGQIAEDGLPSTTMGSNLAVARPPNPYHLHPDRIFVQPLDEKDTDKNAANVQAAVKSCLKHGYRLSLQQHKALGLE